MKQLVGSLALVLAAAAAPAVASGRPSIEGRWTNPKRSVIIDVDRCGPAFCGTVVWANAEAKGDAREGGTRNLVGRRIFSDLKPAGNGAYRGRVFLPKRGIHASATVAPAGSNALSVKGCAIAGVLCREQRWTRVR